MEKSRSAHGLLWGGLTVLVLLAAAGHYLSSRIPSIAQLIPSGSSGMVVNLTSPANGDSVDPSGVTTVLADAIGAQPIAALQLWVDGVLMESKPAVGGPRQQVSTYWAWTPAPGQHILVVSAADEQGRQAYSDPVIVFAADPAGGGLRTYESLPGETLGDIAGKLGVPAVALAASNPDLDPYAPLPGGAPVSVPVPGPAAPVSFPSASPPSGSPGGSPPPAPSDLAIWLSVRRGSDTPPAAPVVSAAVAGCNVDLTITPAGAGAEGIFIYGLDGARSGFRRLATVGAARPGESFTYPVPGGYGPQLYYAASFNAAGESNSNLAAIDISSPECKPPTPTGHRLSGLKVTPLEPVDSMYCYFSIADGIWNRIPAGDGVFVYPLDGAFDFSPYVGMLPPSGVTLKTQCWGWRGGTLVDLGSASGGGLTLGGSLAVEAAAYALSGLVVPADPFGGEWTVMDKDHPGGILAPRGLRRTSSLVDCTDGGMPEFLCKAAILGNSLMLVWDKTTCLFPIEGSKFTCSDYLKETDGYHIYAAPPGKTFTRVANVHDYHQEVYLFDPGRFPIGTRFTVREFGLDMESPDSNVYVLSSIGPGTESVTLTPEILHTTDVGTVDDPDCGFGMFSSDVPGTGTDARYTDGSNVVVGQDYQYPPDSCINWLDHKLYGLVEFNLSTVAGPVARADLSFTQGYSISDQYLYTVPCLDQLGMVTALSGADPSGWDPYRDLPYSGMEGSHHSINATDLVRDWQLGYDNLGFILTPQIDATEGDHYTQQCWTTLYDFQLTVTFFR